MNPEEDNKKAKWRQEKYLEFKEELQQNEKLKKFLENVYPESRESFISEYATNKVRWIEYGPRHIEWLERDDLQWIENATECLKEIQQKKLFDVQCLWRAEKLKIPEVRVTSDFDYWENNIFNCLFIPPVSEEEVQIYIQYIQSSNFERQHDLLDSWQDYKEIKEAYESENANRNFPEWYDFHNGRTGMSAYMLLPDIRGQKEKFYFDLWLDEVHKKTAKNKREEEELKKITGAAGIAPAEETDRRPHLDLYKEGQLTWFVTTFEDQETQDTFNRYGGERPFKEYDGSVEDDLQLLSLSETPPPIEGWYDWKEAVHKAAQKFATAKIIEAMALAYEQYRMNADLKIPYEENKTWEDENDWYANNILRGRELNGEPRDFNF